MNNIINNQSVITYFKKDSVKNRIANALSSKVNIDEFMSNLLIEINKNPDLKECTTESIFQCALDSANFGLVPNKQLGHVWLIPYKKWDPDKEIYIKEAQLQIGYKGYIKKLFENNIVIETELVTHNEVEKGFFQETRGSTSKIIHNPIRTGIRDKNSIALVYAIARKVNMPDIIEVMSIEEIQEAAKTEVYDKNTKKRYKSLKGSWLSLRITDFGEMCKKTVIKRLQKRCGVNVAQQMVAYEGEIDNSKLLHDSSNSQTEPSESVLSNLNTIVSKYVKQ